MIHAKVAAGHARAIALRAGASQRFAPCRRSRLRSAAMSVVEVDVSSGVVMACRIEPGPPTVDVAGDRTRCQQVAGRIANMTGIALVPDALWREAEPSAVLR